MNCIHLYMNKYININICATAIGSDSKYYFEAL